MSDGTVARLRQTHRVGCDCVGCEAADEIERLRSERNEAIIHANNVVRESSSLITAKIPCGSCGGYWNAVDNFRRFESKTT